MNTVKIDQSEIGLIMLSLESTINDLYRRFDVEAGYVHPATQYERLYNKLKIWEENLPVCNYTITAQPV